MVTVISFDALGLSHDYSIEVDPEFPGNGNWEHPTLGLTAKGTSTAFLESPWGAPLVLRVIPDGAEEWIVSVSGGGGLTDLRGLYAAPSPDCFLVVVDGAGLLISAFDLNSVVALGPMITQVLGVTGPRPVILLARPTGVSAIDATGKRWETPRLCWDDLLIERIVGDEVMCSGEFLPRSQFVLSLATGERLSGPVFASPP